MKIQRVLENNTNPFTCSKSDGTESIIVPSENLKGQGKGSLLKFEYLHLKWRVSSYSEAMRARGIIFLVKSSSWFKNIETKQLAKRDSATILLVFKAGAFRY